MKVINILFKILFSSFPLRSLPFQCFFRNWRKKIHTSIKWITFYNLFTQIINNNTQICTKRKSEDHRVRCSLPFKREPLVRSLSLHLCFFEFQKFLFFSRSFSVLFHFISFSSFLVFCRNRRKKIHTSIKWISFQNPFHR